MWLLNTKSLRLEEFLSEDGVRYAILSHRWEREEVSFADIQSLGQARGKHGFAKIANFCQIAASAGYQYGWVDTCCIDKKSSAELSEAINSMYRWYKNAVVCYVYLCDVSYATRSMNFVRSKWFERGWTLQELLAPKNVIFFDCDWHKLGTKENLLQKIQSASGIDESALRGRSINEFNIAERMSWASNRETTRPEDVAYSLLGIFNVNMPMLYGEGNKAFIRLQDQIMKDSDDRTIFAWSGFTTSISGILATSPSFFRKINDVTLRDEMWMDLTNKFFQPHVLTSRGVSIEIELRPFAYRMYSAWVCNAIESALPDTAARVEQSFEIFLRKLPEPGQYERVAYRGRTVRFESRKSQAMVQIAMNRKPTPLPSMTRTINVLQNFDYRSSFSNDVDLYCARSSKYCPFFRISVPSDMRITDVDCLGTWNAEDRVLGTSSAGFGTAGILTLASSGRRAFQLDGNPRVMLLGYDFDFDPVCIVASAKGLKGVKHNDRSLESLLHDMPPDLRTLKIDEITCWETLGWSKISQFCKLDDQLGHYASEVENRPGLWAVRLLGRSFCQFFFENSNWSLWIGPLRATDNPGWTREVQLTTRGLR